MSQPRRRSSRKRRRWPQFGNLDTFRVQARSQTCRSVVPSTCRSCGRWLTKHFFVFDGRVAMLYRLYRRIVVWIRECTFVQHSCAAFESQCLAAHNMSRCYMMLPYLDLLLISLISYMISKSSGVAFCCKHLRSGLQWKHLLDKVPACEFCNKIIT